MILFNRRDAFLFAGVTVIHLIATVSLGVFLFVTRPRPYDIGGPGSLDARIAGWLLTVLTFPGALALYWHSVLLFPGWHILNASIWGLGAVVARRRLRPLEPR
jgi:hypothetical protein